MPSPIKRLAALCAAVCAITSAPSMSHAASRVIFDTDIQTDVDDVGALALLHALADRGEAEILATIVSSKHAYAAPCVQVINEYYGRPSIPIAALQGPGVSLSSNFAQPVAQQFLTAPITLSGQRPDAVKTYRALLASQSDKVTIMTVGYATNLRDLLASGPDEYSSLSGAELVAQKVDKWINMGGNFESRSGIDSSNVNWTRDASAAVTAINNWPTEIVFAGREIGHSMRAGQRLSLTPADNPVRVGYEKYFSGTAQDRHLADLVPVLYAVRGLEYDTGSGIEKYWARESGQISMNADASFTWTKGAAGERVESRLIDSITNPSLGLLTPSVIQERIEDLMITAPRGKDLNAPTAPSGISATPDTHIAGRVALNWTGGQETDTGSWVAGYNVYRQGQRVGTALGTRFFDSVPLAGDYQYTVKTLNASGIESAGITLDMTLGVGAGTGKGLSGEYFDNVDLTNAKLIRTDSSIGFDWGTGKPDASLTDGDSFSVRWTGFIQAAHVSGEELYTFFTRSNDGIRLWVNGQLLVDDWTAGPLREKSGTITLAAGQMYPIKIEYFENTNSAFMELSWSTQHMSREVVPGQRLYTAVPEPAGFLMGPAALLLCRKRVRAK